MSPLRRSERVAKKKQIDEASPHKTNPISPTSSKATRVVKRTSKPQSRKRAPSSASDRSDSPDAAKKSKSVASPTPEFYGEIVPMSPPMPSTRFAMITMDDTPLVRDRRLQSVKYLVNQRASMRPKPASGSFRFLDLSWDIRTQIYDYFAEVPEQGHVLPLAEIQAVPPRYHENLIYSDDPEENAVAEYDEDETMGTPDLEDEEEHNSQRKPTRYVRLVEKERLSTTADAVPIIITRRSLLSVCNQIQQEWAPRFYGSTTVVVHSLKKTKAKRGPMQLSKRNKNKARYNATEFESLYLRTLQPHKICNVRRITYNTSTREHGTTIDFKQFDHLKKLLSMYPDILQSLEVVTLEHSLCMCGKDFYDELDSNLPAACLRLWEDTTDDAKWRKLEKSFRRASQTAVLKDWTSQRNLYRRLPDPRYPGFTVVGLSFVLQKTDASHPLGTAGTVMINDVGDAGYDNDDGNASDDECIDAQAMLYDPNRYEYSDSEEFDSDSDGYHGPSRYGWSSMTSRSYGGEIDDEEDEEIDEGDESDESDQKDGEIDEGDESDESDQNDYRDADDESDYGSGED
jgi:hypothetical protein